MSLHFIRRRRRPLFLTLRPVAGAAAHGLKLVAAFYAAAIALAVAFHIAGLVAELLNL